MGSSFKVASVFGIAVRIHVSFLIYLAFICLSSYQEAGVEGAIQGGLLVLTLFAFVLLHEFGHAFAARTFGIRTPDITLYVIGGVARLTRIPDKPWQELVVAVAGPLVNVVIFVVLRGAIHLEQAQDPENLEKIELLARVANYNWLLLVFNLIPAFPMDGGRVLRSLLAMVMPYPRATEIAARLGQGLAVLFAVYGFFRDPFLVFIALFVFYGAQQELAMARANRSSPP
jgi:Zn-dependent protease